MVKVNYSYLRVVSHIPTCGDAGKSPVGDSASPVLTSTSPTGGAASPKCGICDTAVI